MRPSTVWLANCIEGKPDRLQGAQSKTTAKAAYVLQVACSRDGLCQQLARKPRKCRVLPEICFIEQYQ